MLRASTRENREALLTRSFFSKTIKDCVAALTPQEWISNKNKDREYRNPSGMAANGETQLKWGGKGQRDQVLPEQRRQPFLLKNLFTFVCFFCTWKLVLSIVVFLVQVQNICQGLFHKTCKPYNSSISLLWCSLINFFRQAIISQFDISPRFQLYLLSCVIPLRESTSNLWHLLVGFNFI